MGTEKITDTMQPIPTLYRRGDNFYSSGESVFDLGFGPNKIYRLRLKFKTPGWLAFDFATDVAHTDKGEVSLGKFRLYVDDVLRFEVRGSYTWTRAYIFVDTGDHLFEWRTDENFIADKEDRALLRFLMGTAFVKVDVIDAIELATPPKPIQELRRFETLDGYDRFQQGGFGGAEIEFRMIFAPKDGVRAAEKFAKFEAKYIDFYILRYSSGLYGGTLTKLEPSNKGPLILAETRLNTAQRPGVSVLGL